MGITELRQKDLIELRELMVSIGREQFNLRMQGGLGQMEKPHKVREARRTLARIMMVIGEKMRNSK